MSERIETERLVLREFERDDWAATYSYQQDPRYCAFYPWDTQFEDDARDFVDRFVAWRRVRPRHKFQLAITFADSGELIGNVGIRAEAPGSLIAELGFELAPAHWGNGYATEAARAMLRFAFDNLGLHRVEAHCIAENLASSSVLTRIGMREEGLLRQAEYMKDLWWDVRLFGILREDGSTRVQNSSRIDIR